MDIHLFFKCILHIHLALFPFILDSFTFRFPGNVCLCQNFSKCYILNVFIHFHVECSSSGGKNFVMAAYFSLSKLDLHKQDQKRYCSNIRIFGLSLQFLVCCSHLYYMTLFACYYASYDASL